MKSLLLAVALFTLGIAIGAYVVTTHNQAPGSPKRAASTTPPQPRPPNRDTPIPAPGSLVTPPAPVMEVPDRSADAVERLEQQILTLASDRDRLQRELADLWQRVTMLEKDRFNATDAEANNGDAEAHAVMPTSTPSQRHDTLMAAGLPLSEADRILQYESELELAQLELRDRAIREDWVRSERYRDERRALYERQIDLRAEVGNQVYDQYLFLAGKPNRIKVKSVITGSVAQSAGLANGDVIHSFEGVRVFTPSELNSLNTAGARNELVRISVLRNGQLVETMVPRGPLGLQLDRVREEPDG